MDEILLKQLIRQVKILNFWVSVFGTLTLVFFVLLIIAGFKVAVYVRDTTDKVTNLQSQVQQNIDLKNQICGNSSVSRLLDSSSDICK